MSSISKGEEVMHERRKLGMKMKEKVDQLLPGIPNEITLDHVAPKLMWKDFHVLSSVSRRWQRAIDSREVYNARVRSQSTQTLIALKHSRSTLSSIAVYSINDNFVYHLPPIPAFDQGLPSSCGCVCLAGKLYVLGGNKETATSVGQGISDVYEFDLAGPRHWKRCASMKNPREDFGCGVTGGKIYVFGGTAQHGRPVYGSEVYDPAADSWSPITAQAPWQFHQKVTTVGEELLVHSGCVYNQDVLEWAEDNPYDSHEDYQLREHIEKAYSADVYHPRSDDWREVGSFFDTFAHEQDVVFVAKGKVHKIRQGDIQVFETGANMWKPSQRISYCPIGSDDSFGVTPRAAVVVDEELLAIVLVYSQTIRSRASRGISVMRSQGLGGENEEIVWQKAKCSLYFETLGLHVMCPVQL